MAAKNSTLTAERVRELLDYDPDTGILTWRISASAGGRRRRGAVAGSVNGCGYVCLQADTVKMLAHRVAWVLHYGVWPTQDIDHIDGDTANNRIANLREVTRTVNCQNRKKAHVTNRTGLLGASRDKHGLFLAQIVINGRGRYIGRFPTAAEAHEAYVKAKRKYHEGCTI